ncbi:hypothetical protein I7I53_07977 [Histoplasma capsulatum var. duboisii H88]|uniref:HNH nuclease domain-containing protein n=1 Tax=Ajellomyces capsulatus (strain H88) TaxID=544711 RepID=A0A8A1LI83_AJEC8|nr:hypothetical protein I7I53_07977 [Histoplasma capsulatum var. duboisii H88]
MGPYRHQSSLEALLDFSACQHFTPDQRTRARTKLYSIIDHCNTPRDRSLVKYNRPLLLRYTYEYARSDLSQDMVLSAFVNWLGFSIDGGAINFRDEDVADNLRERLMEFADFLLDNFFTPLKAAGLHTSQPSPPAPLPAVQGAIDGEQKYVGTPDRLSTLRGACLIRDHYRCVISHKFDLTEALKRFKNHGTDAQDEEGNPLHRQSFDSLQVAHILPHALMKLGQDSQLSESKRATLNILDMFDHGVVRLIEGIDIDRPFNAITLSPSLHTLFGGFEIFFEPVPSQLHTYQVKPFLPEIFPDLPVTRTLYPSVDCTIDAPLPRFFAIHSAIAHILHLSGAGEYIDKILRDLENIGGHGGGSTELGRLVMLRLGD